MSHTATLPEARNRAYIVVVIGVIAVSLAAIFIRLAQGQDVPSLLIAAGRLVIAAIILTPMTLRNSTYLKQIRNLKRNDWLLVTTGGMFLAFHFASWVTSLEYTTVLLSVVIVTTAPIWVALLEVFVLRSRLTRGVFIGLFIVIGGSIVIGLNDAGGSDGGGNQLWGALLALIGALTVAVYLIIGKRLRSQLSLVPYIWLVYGFGAIILSLAVVLSGTPVSGYSGEGYLWIIALALIPQLIGHSSLNYALAYLPATFVSITTQAEPIGSAIIAFFVFTETPGSWQIVGSGIILVGVTVATLSQKKD